MNKKEKTVRLANVGELESRLKKYLAEEVAKGNGADILLCEIIESELSDLEELPAIDPETLRPVAHWEESVCFDDAFWVCSNCKFPSEATAAPRLYHYCPNCGAKMGE